VGWSVGFAAREEELEELELEEELGFGFCARAAKELASRNAALKSASRDESREVGITILVRRTPQVYGKRAESGQLIAQHSFRVRHQSRVEQVSLRARF
jgi:hypothetical protein